ncbi:hypothetical protein BGZ81_008114 [Podila clonocystis]|nr:hypothetical protein BGZ81_008114 [Podila clonocystis]
MTNPQETEDIKGMRTYLVCENPPHYLTPVNDSDVPEIVRVLNINKDVYFGTASFQFPFLESHALERLKMVNRYRESLKFNSHFAVRASPTGPFIGWSSFYFPKDGTEVHPETGRPLKIAELGYWISPEHTGKGYATRSVRFILDELVFKEFGCDIGRAEIFSENEASRKTLLKAGLECELEGKVLFIPKFNKDKVLSCFAKHIDNSTLSVRWQA